MPNFSGLWTSRQQLQALGAGIWPAVPGAPTIGTATAGNTTASVTFTAPAYAGYPAVITGYTVTSSPGGFTGTGSASPITVSGLSNGTAYTFTVTATNATGTGAPSAASNSVTPVTPQQVAYTTPGSYTFVAPSGLSPATVSVVCVGGGGRGAGFYDANGGGGGLGYKNGYAVTALNSYTVVVGVPGTSASTTGGDSYFVNTGTVKGGGGSGGTSLGAGGAGGTYTGDGGGNGGKGGDWGSPGGNGQPYPTGGGGGAGGYAGNGGAGANASGSSSVSGSAGSGGGGGGGASGYDTTPNRGESGGGGGGGVGLLGQGASGAGGTGGTNPTSDSINGLVITGKGGSGGQNGQGDSISTYGGLYGGGGTVNGSTTTRGSGAVRIIYSTNGTTRAFPSTNTGDL